MNFWSQLIFLKCSFALSGLVWCCLFGTSFPIWGVASIQAVSWWDLKPHMLCRMRYLVFLSMPSWDDSRSFFNSELKELETQRVIAVPSTVCPWVLIHVPKTPLNLWQYTKYGLLWENQLVSWTSTTEVLWPNKYPPEWGRGKAEGRSSSSLHGSSEICSSNRLWEVKSSFHALQEYITLYFLCHT